MIDLASHSSVLEAGIEAPDTTSLAPETGPEPLLGSPLERYLMKLLEPTEDAPHEQVPQPAGAEHREATPAPRPLAPRPGPRAAAEAPKEFQPLRQMAEYEPVQPPAATKAAPAARPKSVTRSYTPKGKTGDRRQKVMMALIPVLAVAMVGLLKHPLGARPATLAAAAPLGEAVRTAVPEVEIAWEIPTPYEPGGRDPMQSTPPPAAMAVENDPTIIRPTEPPVDLIVTGILYSEDRPSAIVNTQVVYEGQQIAGATVEQIDREGVRFERNGRKWKQPVNQ
jgi:hypothetical protein